MFDFQARRMRARYATKGMDAKAPSTVPSYARWSESFSGAMWGDLGEQVWVLRKDFPLNTPFSRNTTMFLH